jgi:hypothetical protein
MTQNAMVLPNLQLDQWQGLFDVLSMAGRGGGYAAMKAFEVPHSPLEISDSFLQSAWLGSFTNHL